MNTKKKFSRLGTAALATSALLATAATAYAREAEGITEAVPLVVAGDPYAGVVDELESLVGTQSEAELDKLATDSRPAELLVDDNNEVIAGYYVEQVLTPFAITARGPGCATTDACAFNGTNNG